MMKQVEITMSKVKSNLIIQYLNLISVTTGMPGCLTINIAEVGAGVAEKKGLTKEISKSNLKIVCYLQVAPVKQIAPKQIITLM